MIPKDPIILLSFVNTKLRDYYSNVTDLCEDLDINEKELTEKLKSIHYEYNPVKNQFV